MAMIAATRTAVAITAGENHDRATHGGRSPPTRGHETMIATTAQVNSTVTRGYDAGVPRQATEMLGHANIRTASASVACVPMLLVRDMSGQPSTPSGCERESEGVPIEGVAVPLMQHPVPDGQVAYTVRSRRMPPIEGDLTF